MKGKRLRGYTFALITAFCWGVSAVLAKWGVSHLAPPLAGATVALFSGLVTLTLAGGLRHSSNWGKEEKRGLGFFALAGLAASAGVITQYYALSLAPVIVVSPFINASPLLIIILSSLFLKRLERVTPRLVAGSLLIIAGVVLIILTRPS